MCLTIRFKTKKEAVYFKNNPLIAKKDIVVYKTLSEFKGKLISPFQKMIYERGYHYYQTGRAFTFNTIKWRSDIVHLNIEEGLHSAPTLHSANIRLKNLTLLGSRNLVIKKMIIPKGAKYYKNDFEIVSDQLIFP